MGRSRTDNGRGKGAKRIEGSDLLDFAIWTSRQRGFCSMPGRCRNGSMRACGAWSCGGTTAGTRHVRNAFKRTPVRTDRKHALGIERLMRPGRFRPARRKSVPAHATRALLVEQRAQLVLLLVMQRLGWRDWRDRLWLRPSTLCSFCPSLDLSAAQLGLFWHAANK